MRLPLGGGCCGLHGLDCFVVGRVWEASGRVRHACPRFAALVETLLATKRPHGRISTSRDSLGKCAVMGESQAKQIEAPN